MSISKEACPCDKCGVLTSIDFLDSKDDGTGDFTILQCKLCYGPGWLPMAYEPIWHKVYILYRRMARAYSGWKVCHVP